VGFELRRTGPPAAEAWQPDAGGLLSPLQVWPDPGRQTPVRCRVWPTASRAPEPGPLQTNPPLPESGGPGCAALHEV